MPKSSQPVPRPPALPPSGQELYDWVMRKIEPDLVSSALPTLQEKYKGESPEDEKQRKKRYGKALKEYDKQYVVFMNDLQSKVHRYQRDAVKYAETLDRDKEEDVLSTLEAAIQSL